MIFSAQSIKIFGRGRAYLKLKNFKL